MTRSRARRLNFEVHSFLMLQPNIYEDGMLQNSYDVLLLRNMGSTNTPASSSAQSNNNYMHKTEFTWQVARRLAATPEGDGDGLKVSGDSRRWRGWPEGHSEGRLKLRDGVRITIRYKWASCTLQLVWNDSSPRIFLEYSGMSRVFFIMM